MRVARLAGRHVGAPVLAAAVLVLAVAPAARAQRPADRWFGADKVKHFVTAFVAQSVAYAALRVVNAPHGGALAGASAATAAVSVWKERSDRRATGLFSRKDLAWDALGAGAAAAALSHTER
jgi:uncharacterized protein YfiM (DUF2279 family)